MNRVTRVPTFGIDKETLYDEGDMEDQLEQIGGTTKDWIKPAAASMARMNQIQTNVYNMGFRSAGNMKPPRSMKKLIEQQKTTIATQPQSGDTSRLVSARGAGDGLTSYRELEVNPPLSTVSYQKSAWGSNNSIPEMIARYGTPTGIRPSSAKIQTRSRPGSARKARPQSAKEPLFDVKEPKEKKSLGVTGQRKDLLNTKPPPRPPVSNHLGYVAPVTGGKGPSQRKGIAWAGPPAGHKMDSYEDVIGGQNQSDGQPRAPCSSPVFEEKEEIAPKTPPLLRRPLPEPIHLSLPTVDDGDDENADDLDTDRLLKQADDFVLKKEQEQQRSAVASTSSTLPYTSYNNQKQMNLTNSEMKGFSMGNIANEKHSDTSGSKKQISSDPDNFTSSDLSDDIDSCESDSDDDTIYLFRESSVTEKSSNHNDNETGSNLLEKTGQMESSEVLDSQSGNKTPVKFLLPDENSSVYEPLKIGDKQSKGKHGDNTSQVNHQLKGNVKIREDRNITVDITPRNAGKKIASKSGKSGTKRPSSVSCSHKNCMCDRGLSAVGLTDEEMTSLLSRDGSDSASNKSLVSMVTVEYELESDSHSKGDKKNKRKMQSMNDVETMVSKLSSQGSDNISNVVYDTDSSVTQKLVKSQAEKNYYELSRPVSRQNSKPLTTTTEDKPAVEEQNKAMFKTTKTIEFNSENPLEIVSKSEISSLHNGEGKENQKKQSSVIWPSQIKRQKELSKAKKNESVQGTKAKTSEQDIEPSEDSVNLNELENLIQQAKGMAHSSLNNATKERPPSGKKLASKPKKNNSASHPTVTKQEVKAPKPRPLSAEVKAASMTDISRSKEAIQALRKDKEEKRYSMYSIKPATITRRVQSAGSTRPKPLRPGPSLSSLKPQDELETPENEECREMQSKMADLGLYIDHQVLERALFPPSGKSLYYEVPGNLPRNPTSGLVPHYKYWLAEDYQRLQLMKRRLARDDLIKYNQKLAAEKKKKKKAGKKGGKKKGTPELCRRNSVA